MLSKKSSKSSTIPVCLSESCLSHDVICARCYSERNSPCHFGKFTVVLRTKKAGQTSLDSWGPSKANPVLKLVLTLGKESFKSLLNLKIMGSLLSEQCVVKKRFLDRKLLLL